MRVLCHTCPKVERSCKETTHLGFNYHQSSSFGVVHGGGGGGGGGGGSLLPCVGSLVQMCSVKRRCAMRLLAVTPVKKCPIIFGAHFLLEQGQGHQITKPPTL